MIIYPDIHVSHLSSDRLARPHLPELHHICSRLEDCWPPASLRAEQAYLIINMVNITGLELWRFTVNHLIILNYIDSAT